MQVRSGNIVQMRDGRIVRVTDAAESGDPEGTYQWIDQVAFKEQGREVVKAEIPAETIFVGYEVHPELYEDPNLGEPGYVPQVVVSDMSEIVAVIED